MQRKTTLKDLSKILKLSVSTISKALHDSPEISKETRGRVREAATTNKYSPNLLAQSLQANKTRTIGVVVPDVLAFFFAKAIHGIEKTASKFGYKLFICLSNEFISKEAESLESLINSNVDGVIMSLAKETQLLNNYYHFENAVKYNLPLVLFDRTTSRLICDKVSINDKKAAKEATNHLLRTGCKKIAFLSTIYGTSVGTRRNLGYAEAIKEAGLQECSVNIENYLAFEKTLIEIIRKEKLDGIVAADELSAVSIMRYALRNNYRIPEEISVIGFTNGILGENFVPSLTTVEQHAEEQGSLACELLIRRIENKTPVEPFQEVLKTSIIERESTRLSIYAK